MARTVSRFQETGQHIARQSDQFVLRTRDAGRAFVAETREAGHDVVVFMRAEMKRWRHYAASYAARLGGEVRAAVSLPEVERRLLVRIGGTLRTLDTRVRGRLLALERRGRKPSRKSPKSGPRRRKPRESAQRLVA